MRIYSQNNEKIRPVKYMTCPKQQIANRFRILENSQHVSSIAKAEIESGVWTDVVEYWRHKDRKNRDNNEDL